MTYDPTEDPRWLGQNITVDAQMLEEIALLPKVQAVLDLFDSEGWPELERILEARLREAELAAINASSYEELVGHQGRIGAFRTFLSIQPSLRVEQERLLEMQANLADSGE